MAAVGFLLLVVILIAIVFRADPLRRVAQEHGITLPASISEIECRGDAWKRSFIDCGAICTFEMPASDLPAFLKTLTIHKSSRGVGDTIVPGNSQYAVTAAWTFTTPDFAFDCESPTGDFLTVRTWDLSSSDVGVLLYTDWN